MLTLSGHSVSVCLIWPHHHIILNWWSGWPMPTLSKYLVSVHLIRAHHHTILNWWSGWPMPTPSEYLVFFCQIRPHHIELAVRLTNSYTEWIFGNCLPNPTTPPYDIESSLSLSFQWTCSLHQLNIMYIIIDWYGSYTKQSAHWIQLDSKYLMLDSQIMSHYPSDTLATSIRYCSAEPHNTYIIYNPVE